MEHYRVKINKIPMHGNNEWISPRMVHEELATYVPQYKSLRYLRLPKWIRTDETICTKNFASIVIDLSNIKDRDMLLSLKMVYLFNMKCMITPYEDQIQIHMCSKCGMLSHCTAICNQPCCLKCSAKDHKTEAHPAESEPQCINCKGKHKCAHKDCKAR
jgi:hypothetical protein